MGVARWLQTRVREEATLCVANDGVQCPRRQVAHRRIDHEVIGRNALRVVPLTQDELSQAKRTKFSPLRGAERSLLDNGRVQAGSRAHAPYRRRLVVPWAKEEVGVPRVMLHRPQLHEVCDHKFPGRLVYAINLAHKGITLSSRISRELRA